MIDLYSLFGKGSTTRRIRRIRQSAFSTHPSYIEDFRYDCDYYFVTSLFVSYTLTVAANILSRKNHEIGGSPLEVKQLVKEETSDMQYEQDKIKITSTIPQHLLLLCVETQFDMDEKDFDLKMITDESYILVFNSAHTIKGIFVLKCYAPLIST